MVVWYPPLVRSIGGEPIWPIPELFCRTSYLPHGLVQWGHRRSEKKVRGSAISCPHRSSARMGDTTRPSAALLELNWVPE